MNWKNPNTTLVFCLLRVIPVIVITIAIVIIIVTVVVTVIVIYVIYGICCECQEILAYALRGNHSG